MKHTVSIKKLSICCIIALMSCDQDKQATVTSLDYLDCSAFSWTTEDMEFYRHTKCGTIDKSGTIRLDHNVVKLINFSGSTDSNKEQLSDDQIMYPPHLKCLPIRSAVSGGFSLAYFNESGRGRTTPLFDNHCMPFKDGISFGYVDGNVVYFDTDLNILKKTNYRFAKGWNVCSEIPNRYYRPGTYEHPEWRGGTCGLIDKNFNIIVPIEYPIDKIPSDTVASE